MRRRPASALLAVLLGLGLLAGCVAGISEDALPAATATTAPGAGPTSAPGATPPPVEPAEHAELGSWETCADDFECTTLTVPRDWTDLEGPTLDLAVTRRTATGESLGALVLNPGGPGASGVEFVQGFVESGLPPELAERFDVVSWDPRGTGGSERIDCTDDAELLEAEPDPTPDDAEEVAALRADAAEASETCRAEVGDLLAQVGTRDTVRDLEALRGALGEEELTYLGYSYGTTLGLEYLRAYPERTRAMVLDAVAVPGVDPLVDTRTQAEGFESTLDAYLAGCADRPRCPLGSDPKARLLALADAVDQEPVPASYRIQTPGAVDRTGTLGLGEMYLGIASALYTTQAWPTLDAGLAELLADEPQGRTLLALRDEYLGRQPDGTWLDDHDARAAIRCADQAERPDQPEGDLDLAAEWAADLPFWGGWFAVGAPGCWGLPEAIDPLPPLRAEELADAPPVVLVGSTEDPATPFSQATDALALLPNARLITYEGAEHTVVKGLTACVDDPVVAYLVAGEMPEPDLRCQA